MWERDPKNPKIYHLITRGIDGKEIFPSDEYYDRFLDLMDYYRFNPDVRFSHFKRLDRKIQEKKKGNLVPIVDLLAFVLMPNHVHILIEELEPGSLTIYCRRLLDSYTRYFNTQNNRKGTLYQGNVKVIPVESDEYLLHLTIYIHLNPCTAGLVEKPEEWKYSSYLEYLGIRTGFCTPYKYLSVGKDVYRKFVEERIDYQRTLAIVKAHFNKARFQI